MSDKIKVLVVDDSISLVDGLVQILQVSGYDVDPAYNGHDALRKITTKTYDLVVSDIEMPGMNGLELLEYVRKDYDQISFILMTGYLEQDYFIRAIQLGASDFIRKPIDTEHLLNSIQLQINKKKEDIDFLSVSNKASLLDIKLSLPSHMFRQVDFIKIFTRFFSQSLSLPKPIGNEMLLCMEEMLYNAFIHGTLRLNMKERTLSYEDYKNLIYTKLKDKEIADKKIHIRLSINQIRHTICFEVEDEGQGFDYKSWMTKVRHSDGIQLDEYGRGISILFHLTDKVSFSKGGRLVRIEKNIKQSA